MYLDISKLLKLNKLNEWTIFVVTGKEETYGAAYLGGFNLPCWNMVTEGEEVSWCTLGFPQGDASFPTCEYFLK